MLVFRRRKNSFMSNPMLMNCLIKRELWKFDELDFSFYITLTGWAAPETVILSSQTYSSYLHWRHDGEMLTGIELPLSWSEIVHRKSFCCIVLSTFRSVPTQSVKIKAITVRISISVMYFKYEMLWRAWIMYNRWLIKVRTGWRKEFLSQGSFGYRQKRVLNDNQSCLKTPKAVVYPLLRLKPPKVHFEHHIYPVFLFYYMGTGVFA